LTLPSVGEEMEQPELSYHTLYGNVNGINTWKTVWQVLIKLSILLYDPAISLLGICFSQTFITVRKYLSKICVCMCVCIYIQREREREREIREGSFILFNGFQRF
jgi:hypothetical protein